MKKTKNEAPFALLGFAYSDYSSWCEKHSKKEGRDSKKEFFAKALRFEIVKVKGEVIEEKEEAL